MKIKSKNRDARGYDYFIVKGTDKEVQDYFFNEYPGMSIGILEHLNNRGTFEVYVMPKEDVYEEN